MNIQSVVAGNWLCRRDTSDKNGGLLSSRSCFGARYQKMSSAACCHSLLFFTDGYPTGCLKSILAYRSGAYEIGVLSCFRAYTQLHRVCLWPNNVRKDPMSEITRRDFINGTLMAAGSSMLPLEANGDAAMAALNPSYYPPARTGLRGSHPGSDEHAHSRAWNGRSDWGPNHQAIRDLRPRCCRRWAQRAVGCVFLSARATAETRKCSYWTTMTILGVMPKGMNIRLVVKHYWVKAVQSPLRIHMNFEKSYAIL